MGMEVKLLAPHFVSPYRLSGKTGKNDAADAAAICEAASRPTMRFVAVKSVEQQSMMALHRWREDYKEERTACINRIRGLLAEFGLVFAQRPEVLRAVLSEVVEDATNELGAIAHMALRRAQLHWIELECHIAWYDERIARARARRRASQGGCQALRHRPRHRLGTGGHGRRLQAIQEWPSVQCLDGFCLSAQRRSRSLDLGGPLPIALPGTVRSFGRLNSRPSRTPAPGHDLPVTR